MAEDPSTFPPPGWPTVTYEERDWKATADATIPRRRRHKHTGPYLAAIPPNIARISAIRLSSETFALSDEASTEIARFDAEIGSEIAPFTSLLLRSESAASSKIENLTASAKAIALAEIGDLTRHNANIIVANTRSMEAAIALADRLDVQAILNMHEILLGQTHPEWTGRWRDVQVWIGGSDFGPHGATFIPPHQDRVRTAMDDLVEFLQRDDLPPLIQAAIAHAQFETIHPFPDGNGRTGRSLIHALLRAKGLTRIVTVPVSAGLLTDTKNYFNALSAYRDGDITSIVELIANAAFLAIANAQQLVYDLQEIRASWNESIRVRRDAAAWKVADYLIHHPVIDSPFLQQELGIAATNINSAIEHLEEIGVLQRIAGNYRNRKWAAPQVLSALDNFAERAGRRNRAG